MFSIRHTCHRLFQFLFRKDLDKFVLNTRNAYMSQLLASTGTGTDLYQTCTDLYNTQRIQCYYYRLYISLLV